MGIRVGTAQMKTGVAAGVGTEGGVVGQQTAEPARLVAAGSRVRESVPDSVRAASALRRAVAAEDGLRAVVDAAGHTGQQWDAAAREMSALSLRAFSGVADPLEQAALAGQLGYGVAFQRDRLAARAQAAHRDELRQLRADRLRGMLRDAANAGSMVGGSATPEFRQQAMSHFSGMLRAMDETYRSTGAGLGESAENTEAGMRSARSGLAGAFVEAVSAADPVFAQSVLRQMEPVLTPGDRNAAHAAVMRGTEQTVWEKLDATFGLSATDWDERTEQLPSPRQAEGAGHAEGSLQTDRADQASSPVPRSSSSSSSSSSSVQADRAGEAAQTDRADQREGQDSADNTGASVTEKKGRAGVSEYVATATQDNASTRSIPHAGASSAVSVSEWLTATRSAMRGAFAAAHAGVEDMARQYGINLEGTDGTESGKEHLPARLRDRLNVLLAQKEATLEGEQARRRRETADAFYAQVDAGNVDEAYHLLEGRSARVFSGTQREKLRQFLALPGGGTDPAVLLDTVRRLGSGELRDPWDIVPDATLSHEDAGLLRETLLAEGSGAVMENRLAANVIRQLLDRMGDAPVQTQAEAVRSVYSLLRETRRKGESVIPRLLPGGPKGVLEGIFAAYTQPLA